MVNRNRLWETNIRTLTKQGWPSVRFLGWSIDRVALYCPDLRLYRSFELRKKQTMEEKSETPALKNKSTFERSCASALRYCHTPDCKLSVESFINVNFFRKSDIPYLSSVFLFSGWKPIDDDNVRSMCMKGTVKISFLACWAMSMVRASTIRKRKHAVYSFKKNVSIFVSFSGWRWLLDHLFFF